MLYCHANLPHLHTHSNAKSTSAFPCGKPTYDVTDPARPENPNNTRKSSPPKASGNKATKQIISPMHLRLIHDLGTRLSRSTLSWQGNSVQSIRYAVIHLTLYSPSSAIASQRVSNSRKMWHLGECVRFAGGLPCQIIGFEEEEHNSRHIR